MFPPSIIVPPSGPSAPTDGRPPRAAGTADVKYGVVIDECGNVPACRVSCVSLSHDLKYTEELYKVGTRLEVNDVPSLISDIHRIFIRFLVF